MERINLKMPQTHVFLWVSAGKSQETPSIASNFPGLNYMARFKRFLWCNKVFEKEDVFRYVTKKREREKII